MEVIISVIENQPGETIARHIHHGAEVFYVLQGATLETAVRRADHSAGRRKRHQSP
jgi:quercetin dioxygenase-like cupin family protein